MQTLPGVQNVDEGTGLFVRGGDVSETKVLLNNIVMLSPYNYETPTGNFTVTVNPFLLDGIFFSSGGFGARYGNILSGVADLRTAGRPAAEQRDGGRRAGERLDRAPTSRSRTASRCTRRPRATTRTTSSSSTAATRAYSPAPNGEDFSGSVVYNYRPTGRDQNVRHRPAQRARNRRRRSVVRRRIRRRTSAARWPSRDGETCSATFSPTISVSYSKARRNEGFGVFDARHRRALVAGVRADGVESATTATTFASAAISTGATAGSSARFPRRSPIAAPARRSSLFDSKARRRPKRRVRRGGSGVRSRICGSSPARAPTTRASRTRSHGRSAALGGVQDRRRDAHGGGRRIPSGLRSAVLRVGDRRSRARPDVGRSSTSPARSSAKAARSRASSCTTSEYHDLVGLTRDKDVTSGGVGTRARRRRVRQAPALAVLLGARDATATSTRGAPIPNTRRRMRAAPFDITHSMALIGDQALAERLERERGVALCDRKAVHARHRRDVRRAARRRVACRSYAAPNSERLAELEEARHRAVARHAHRAEQRSSSTSSRSTTCSIATNLYQYTYNADYTRRIPVRSLFNRSVYFGGFAHPHRTLIMKRIDTACSSRRSRRGAAFAREAQGNAPAKWADTISAEIEQGADRRRRRRGSTRPSRWRRRVAIGVSERRLDSALSRATRFIARRFCSWPRAATRRRCSSRRNRFSSDR